jgi:uncharacterized protein
MTEIITRSRQANSPEHKSARAPFHVMAKPIGPLCNLDCEYCFYLKKADMFKGSRFRISDKLLETHIRGYIDSQPDGCTEVNFAWQGGEPTLLGVDFFKTVIAQQKKLRRPGMHISNALQTNGTKLDDEWCEFLRENSFLVGVSIDGPEELHDHYRKTKGGKGSYQQVKKGLDCLRNHQVEFNILTVIQRHNADYPLKVYQDLKDEGAEHIQFIPIVERQGIKGVSGRSVLPEQYGSFMTTVFDEWLNRDIGRVYIQQFESALSSSMGKGATICTHSRECGRALALEHNGNVYACDHFVSDDYQIGNIQQLNYRDMVDGTKQSGFGQAKLTHLTNRCKRCDVRSLCNGGCPAQHFVQASNEKFLHNYLCEGYKTFFRHVKPYLDAMAQSLKNNLPAAQYNRFLSSSKFATGRNSPCPCGSGMKFKKCCG